MYAAEQQRLGLEDSHKDLSKITDNNYNVFDAMRIFTARKAYQGRYKPLVDRIVAGKVSSFSHRDLGMLGGLGRPLVNPEYIPIVKEIKVLLAEQGFEAVTDRNGGYNCRRVSYSQIPVSKAFTKTKTKKNKKRNQRESVVLAEPIQRVVKPRKETLIPQFDEAVIGRKVLISKVGNKIIGVDVETYEAFALC